MRNIFKENKKLKEENNKLKTIVSQYLEDFLKEIIKKEYISKGKIKAKIEPRLKELDENMKKEWKEYGNSREYQDMEDEWNFLQSLLERRIKMGNEIFEEIKRKYKKSRSNTKENK